MIYLAECERGSGKGGHKAQNVKETRQFVNGHIGESFNTLAKFGR